ncbi:EamA domain-containing protein [Entamoeba marina]
MSSLSISQFFKKYVAMVIIVVMFLLTGTTTTIFSKSAYQTDGEGRYGDVHLFEKPLFFNWSMFLGMSFCLVIYLVQYHVVPLFVKDYKSEEESMTWKGYLLIIIPSLCDFVATYLMNFGLLINHCIYCHFFLYSTENKKIYVFEMVGVAIIVISLAIIGSAAFAPGAQDGSSGSDDGDPWYLVLIGIVLILLAQLSQAFQTIVEEQFLHDVKAPVNFIVGLEGLYGLIICTILMPIMNLDFLPDDIQEDTIDTFIMLGHSWLLIFFSVGYVVSVLLFNYTGMMITDYVNAMVRNVMEPMRMISIWALSVSLYYIDNTYGEKVGWFTFIEIAGFILLTIGFCLYTKVFKIKAIFKYPTPQPSEEGYHSIEGPDEEKKRR